MFCCNPSDFTSAGLGPAAAPRLIERGPVDGRNVLLPVAPLFPHPQPIIHLLFKKLFYYIYDYQPSLWKNNIENYIIEKERCIMTEQINQNTDVLDRANSIMNNAIDTAGDLIVTKPLVAEVVLKQLLKIDPEHLSGLQLLGLCKHRMGDNVEAIEIIQTALDIDPTCSDNWNNMGLAYGALENHEKAIECLEKAIEFNPDHCLYMNNLALQYRSVSRRTEAMDLLIKAVRLDTTPQMLVNLGAIYGELKRHDKAIECFDLAVAIEPDYAPAHVDLTFSHALNGDWEKCFEEYQWRFDYYTQLEYYKKEYDQEKLWNGEDSLSGKTILLYCEQGVGDGIQFIRYTKQLKDMGATVYAHCNPGLSKILGRLDTVDKTVNRDIVNKKGSKLPEYDYQCAIMSLPYLLKNFDISGEPYIKPATDKFRQHLKDEYGSDSFNIGIVWAGSPAHPHDKRRSVPLKNFETLQDVEGTKWFSLQMDTRKRQYGTTCNFEHNSNDEKFQPSSVVDYCEDVENIELIDLTSMIQDYEDTATVLSGLDLVICCDTSVLHLAGAMGVPAWGLIAYNPDWRWCLDGDTTEWYDSVKLFRQEERDNWEKVMIEVKKELHETVLQNK